MGGWIRNSKDKIITDLLFIAFLSASGEDRVSAAAGRDAERVPAPRPSEHHEAGTHGSQRAALHPHLRQAGQSL
jgi:hypothetical protein